MMSGKNRIPAAIKVMPVKIQRFALFRQSVYAEVSFAFVFLSNRSGSFHSLRYGLSFSFTENRRTVAAIISTIKMRIPS